MELEAIDEFEGYGQIRDIEFSVPQKTYHEAICPQRLPENWGFSRRVTSLKSEGFAEKIERCFDQARKPMDVNVSGTAEVVIKIGGSDSGKTTVNVQGGIHDNRGNTAGVKIEKKNDDDGAKATIYAGYDSAKKKDKGK